VVAITTTLLTRLKQLAVVAVVTATKTENAVKKMKCLHIGTGDQSLCGGFFFTSF
jgi:2-keto-3-deoxy-6-phosphogluconate aldolase